MAYKTKQKPFPRRKCSECGKTFRPWFKYQEKCYDCDKRGLLEKWSGADSKPAIEVIEKG